MTANETQSQKEPPHNGGGRGRTREPGAYLIPLCSRSKVAKTVLGHFHLDKIPGDYRILYFEADGEEAKQAVWDEYVREVKLALLVPLGVHAGLAAILHPLVSNFTTVAGWYAVIAVTVWLMIKRVL